MGINIQGNPKQTKFLASLGLIVTTIIWGSAFVVMKNSVDKVSPCYLLAVRFSVAAVCMLGVFWPQNKKITKKDIRCGIILGIYQLLLSNLWTKIYYSQQKCFYHNTICHYSSFSALAVQPQTPVREESGSSRNCRNWSGLAVIGRRLFY